MPTMTEPNVETAMGDCVVPEQLGNASDHWFGTAGGCELNMRILGK